MSIKEKNSVVSKNYKVNCPNCLYWDNRKRSSELVIVGQHIDVNNIGLRWYCCDNCLWEVKLAGISNSSERYQKRINLAYLKGRDLSLFNKNRLIQLFSQGTVNQALQLRDSS